MIYDKIKWVLIYVVLTGMSVGMYYMKVIRIYGYPIIEMNSFILGCISVMVYLFGQRKNLSKSTVTFRQIVIILSYPLVFSCLFIPHVSAGSFYRMTVDDDMAQFIHFSVSLLLVMFYTLPLILFRNDSTTVNVIAFPVSLYIVASAVRLMEYFIADDTINVFLIETFALLGSLLFTFYLIMIRRHSGLFFEKKTRKTTIF